MSHDDLLEPGSFSEDEVNACVAWTAVFASRQLGESAAVDAGETGLYCSGNSHCPSPMRLSRSARNLLRTAMLLMVAMVVGHIHSHRCLDGQEPALSVHFEAFNGHPDHDGDDYHDDVENELVPQGLPGKAPDHDAPLFLLALSLLFTFKPVPRQLQIERRDTHSCPPPPRRLPPSRAPPAHSS